MKRYILIAIAMLSLTACKRDNGDELSDKSIFDGGHQYSQTTLDRFIYNNFQRPYNIAVTYKWIDADFEQNKFLYPPTREKVQPMLEIVKKVWIDPYVEVAGADFIKTVAPRQISLIGGYNRNTDGTITLGFADSGMKITLFNVDQLDITQQQATRQYFHTIQHEYCHIINQHKPYSDEYRKITPSDYTAQWFNVKDVDALNKGFITPYAMANDIEDFAEMTSAILSMSKAQFDAKINAVTNANGKAALRSKEKMVAEYFKSEWNIDIYQLQDLVERRMLEVLNP